MKKAGELLSAFFDKGTLKKAQEYGVLFSSWIELLKKCGLPQGGSHSQIIALEKSVLVVEADHPGWIQLLQTKQRELLEAVRRQFPEITLSGISLRLSRTQSINNIQGPGGADDPRCALVPGSVQDLTGTQEAGSFASSPGQGKLQTQGERPEQKNTAADAPEFTCDSSSPAAIEAIGDENLRNLLRRLEQSIVERNGVSKKST
ncbi:MAG: DUF721 domain-containing protein [Spirochaetaceae bacterium]|jgi:hypothetical protein|nr:DUF721 domain-containing protein [Spirochaetaceae bacterium]